MFKDKQYELVVKYYSLAMDYVPQTTDGSDKLIAVLLSNRCAAYLNLEMYDKATEDAKKCVQIEPDWSKVHGTTLCMGTGLIRRQLQWYPNKFQGTESQNVL